MIKAWTRSTDIYGAAAKSRGTRASHVNSYAPVQSISFPSNGHRRLWILMER